VTTELPPGLEDAPASRLYPLQAGCVAVIVSGLAVWVLDILLLQVVWLIVVVASLPRWVRR
jgi:hypothetical protein